ncbi:5-methyltetrahydropteroyltriglutamate--homocysteine S-methyltransferase [Shewanella sp. C32]|uniref:5-methyltetrahydropteroyltriglutamate--homocysteine S-methyltransferase n=1 Tax=Shewanella electrica TaxID=515560 RepID=A0ABT2FN73_9GAMM|nr:5-methyltetrahydropteroyltriglutamate--homocysteine S-methyltransferase [Shewanella electrica]MCH1926247.1 5-methyltetrahydropteroyltriglutamate--homocysteine S-methyltransferase [Shewanella electrica]MCS4557785.1 5-methyltetrahydropteroyltriglutamate--homocysteine S-methyltransferase [Shewanella electrica]
MAHQLPFRSDVVGSYLRPAYLHQARRDFTANKIDKAELTAIEDRAITELVAQQKAAGLKVITDGEFRRGFWHIDFLENLNGVEGYVPEQGYNQKFHGKAAPSYNIRVHDKISFNTDHPFLAHFAFLKTLADADGEVVAKATIPSPTMILRQEVLANEDISHLQTIYPDLADFYQDLATTYRAAVKAFYDAGCRYLQFDDTNWAFLADASKRESLQAKGIDADQIADICADIINGALADKPADMTITTHICRGNHASSWLFSGGYEPIAKQLFASNYDGFFLEYDNDRAGDFAPLRHWANNGSRIVLGLVTSKFPELEDTALIKARIQEATEYVPLDNLCLSPQCGFASTEEGNKLSIDEQWNKIKLVNQVAQSVWQDA